MPKPVRTVPLPVSLTTLTQNYAFCLRTQGVFPPLNELSEIITSTSIVQQNSNVSAILARRSGMH